MSSVVRVQSMHVVVSGERVGMRLEGISQWVNDKGIKLIHGP